MSKSDLIIHSDEPYNAEPALARLRSSPLTAQADFYVRSHGNTPHVVAKDFFLHVGGLVAKPLTLSLDDLHLFPQACVEATMQCAGNRRVDMTKLRPVAGDPWSAGAIGNARWSGVRLSSVLAAAGADTAPGLHVGFSSLDDVEMDGKSFRFGASIPMPKAMSPETLVAFAMNDAPLEPRHGFPLRIVTPGFAGVRSPKWLATIEVRASPSDCPIQAEDYMLLPPDIQRVDDIDWTRGVVINDLPVNSAICEPHAHAHLPAGRHRVRGWAFATARGISRVDVSGDGGRSWRQARLEAQQSIWSWVLWEADLDLEPGEHELVVRAWDTAGQTQPATTDDIWNVKGYLNSSWHTVPVAVRSHGS